MNNRHLAFPFRIGADGRTQTPQDINEQVQGEIMQLLLTTAGERPFLPSFGGGLRRLVFERNDEVTAGMTKATISQAINHWLSERVELQVLDVQASESTLSVDLRYKVIATGEQKQLRFQHDTEA